MVTSKELQAIRGLQKLQRQRQKERERKAAAGLLKLRQPTKKRKLTPSGRCTKTNKSPRCETKRCIRANMKKNMRTYKKKKPYNQAVSASLKSSYKACGVPLPKRKAPPKRTSVKWK